MQKQTINQKDPEKEFILCKNVSGATLSAGAAVYFDTASATDGFAVSGARTGMKFLFAGINDQSLSSNSKGLVQTYGIASAYVTTGDSAVSAITGQQCDAVTSATHLKASVTTDYFTATSSAAWTGGNPWNFVTLMEGIASGVAASTAALKSVFIRAR